MIETISHLILDPPTVVEKTDLEDEYLELEKIIRMFYCSELHILESWKESHPESEYSTSDYLKLSEHPGIYKHNDYEHYSVKGCHRERTLGNEKTRRGGHREHWKKEKRKKLMQRQRKV